MKISELINTLEYELKNNGDLDVYISIDPQNKNSLTNNNGLLSTTNLVTSCDNTDVNKWEFGIRNWSM